MRWHPHPQGGFSPAPDSPRPAILVTMPRSRRERRIPARVAPAQRAVRRRAQRLFDRVQPNWWGAVGSIVASWIALGPSFLPRRWWTTAASVSLSQLYGYALGSGARALRRGAARLLRRRRDARGPAAAPTPSLPMATVERTWQTVLLSALTLGSAATLISALDRQREIARLVDETPQTALQQLRGVGAGSAATAAVLGLVSLFRASSAKTRELIARVAPALAAPLSGTAVMFGLTYWLNRSVVWSRLMRRIEATARANNLRPLPGRTAPEQPERSGSAASFEPFESLGRHGKAVASDGPRAADIAAFWGEPALEPVRAYVGLSATLPIEEAAKRAVRELRRAGGFEREHVVIMVGTGTGWVNDWSMAALEFLTRGDCAVVSLQYTVLPSAFALLLDRRSPKTTGRALLREVRAELDRLPEGERPRLYMTGESLGAFGGLSAFSSSTDLLERLDGAVWAGTPQFSPIWRELVQRRRPGSPQIRPDIGDGSAIRFSNRPGDALVRHDGAPNAPWGPSRVMFLQHPSDPVVWWHPSLIWRKPLWMDEPRGYDVTDRMDWWPWVTFWQVSADMPLSLANRGGHAHRYFEAYVTAWSEVLGIPVDDPDAVADAIRPHILPH